jgi:hypothetical protein
MTTDYLSLVLTPLRFRWTIPLKRRGLGLSYYTYKTKLIFFRTIRHFNDQQSRCLTVQRTGKIKIQGSNSPKAQGSSVQRDTAVQAPISPRTSSQTFHESKGQPPKSPAVPLSYDLDIHSRIQQSKRTAGGLAVPRYPRLQQSSNLKVLYGISGFQQYSSPMV